MKLAGVVLAFVWMVHAETPIAAKLCDIFKRPDHFKDKLVSVRTEVVVGFETQALVDGSCPNEQIWFTLDEPKRGNEYRALNHAWKNNEFNIRKKVSATLLGVYEAGNCFGHQCFSKSQLRVRRVMNVTSVERRLAEDFSVHDCNLITRDLRVHFQKGHMDNVPEAPLLLGSRKIVLTGPNDQVLTTEAHPIFQIALTPRLMKVLEPKDGVFQLLPLSPGAYVFSAVAKGFQSVTGCFLVPPNVTNQEPIRIELPLGV